MHQLIFAFVFFASLFPQPFRVQYVQGASGQSVQVLIDGRHVETTFAGKLGFRDGKRSWTSVCADLRSPIANGQYFPVRALKSSEAGGRIARAGNIVAKYFK